MFQSRNERVDDTLYEFNASLDTPGTSYGKAPMSALNKPPATSTQRQLFTSMGRTSIGTRSGVLGTANRRSPGNTDARPMTSISGAGYHGGNKDNNNRQFDPLNIVKGHAPPLADKSDGSFENKAKELENDVHRLFEASALAIANHEYANALEKAKEASKTEKTLRKFRESHNLGDSINADLTYSISFNLANAYYRNKMYDDAINLYQLVLKNKQFPQSSRVRINLGNIYFEQKKYPWAIKMYRMAIDQISASNQELKCRIFRNIGNSFIRLGQFQDAIDSYESALKGSPDLQTAYNLLVCLYARGDTDKMKKQFVKLITIPVAGVAEEEHETALGRDRSNDDNMFLHLDKQDLLKDEASKRQDDYNDKILNVARMIAPTIGEGGDWVQGYKWVIDEVRHENEHVASKLELDLAMVYMKKGQFENAIDVLKSFDKKDQLLRAMAATNMSFIHFLEGDYVLADKHADLAIKYDRYNAKGLVNKGNCFYVSQQYARAKELYLEAVGVEADCVEAIFNLGLVNLRMNSFQEAHGAFDKLHTVLPTVPEALFNLGTIYEHGDNKTDLEQASKTYEMLLSKVPTDANICSKISSVYERLDDESAACHWQLESHRHYPVNLKVISWLGVWYVKREMYDEAIGYFNIAAAVQPGEPKWRLMVASCYRRLGDLHRSLDLYLQIHESAPDNIEALQYVEALCRDVGRPHELYAVKLDKLRKNASIRGAMAGSTPLQTVPARDSAPLRSERPERSARPDRQQQPQAISGAATVPDSLPNASTHSSIPSVQRSGGTLASRTHSLSPPRSTSLAAQIQEPAKNPNLRRQANDDDFADTDVTNLLG